MLDSPDPSDKMLQCIFFLLSDYEHFGKFINYKHLFLGGVHLVELFIRENLLYANVNVKSCKIFGSFL